MFPVREFTDGPAGFPSLINYFEFVDEGVLFNRDGSLLGCFYFRGPDMDSSLGLEEDQLASQIQSIFQNFGNVWSLHVDLIRVPAVDYPKKNYFNNPTSILIEKHRRERYEREGDHFENIYAISFSYLPSVVENKAINSFFVLNSQKDEAPSLDFIVEVFNQKLNEFQGNISNKLRIKRMNSAEMMTFLNRCIAGVKTETPLPQPACYLNHWNTGHTGGVSTVHANSAQSGLLRLEQLILEAGVPVVPEAIVEAVNVLVFIQKTNRGKKGRQVTAILGLKGYDKAQGYLTEELSYGFS